MKPDIALKRYLERHIEPDLPDAPPGLKRWQHVLVIPAYDEPDVLLATLSALNADEYILVILVLNRPDSDRNSGVNSSLRRALGNMATTASSAGNPRQIIPLNDSVDLLFYDMEICKGPSPASEGVGLARKVGCDIALLWQSQGAIVGDWICSTDADARLPADYFSRLEEAGNSAAAVYPFFHYPGVSESVNNATALYELRLHQYVFGLNYANSPYAFHTLGSVLAVRGRCYAQVRGYPKRAGGEDFYLLNKLSKVGPIASLDGACIALESRASHRVPFGTGPATQKIIREGKAEESLLFYHPQCFDALRATLATVNQLRSKNLKELGRSLQIAGLGSPLANTTENALLTMGLSKAIEHCRKQGKSEVQFLRHFHQWFDGFRTLKFIHAVRDAGWPMVSLAESINLQPMVFPNTISADMNIDTIRADITLERGWLT